MSDEQFDADAILADMGAAITSGALNPDNCHKLGMTRGQFDIAASLNPSATFVATPGADFFERDAILADIEGAVNAGALTQDNAHMIAMSRGEYALMLAIIQAIAAGGSAIEVEDEGVSLTTSVTKINFVGAGVTATEPSPNEVTVTIPGGGSSISNPYIAYVRTNGDDGTAEIGNPAKPFETVLAAFNAEGWVDPNKRAFDLGVGSFDLTLENSSAANNDLEIFVTGQGSFQTSLHFTFSGETGTSLLAPPNCSIKLESDLSVAILLEASGGPGLAGQNGADAVPDPGDPEAPVNGEDAPDIYGDGGEGGRFGFTGHSLKLSSGSFISGGGGGEGGQGGSGVNGGASGAPGLGGNPGDIMFARLIFCDIADDTSGNFEYNTWASMINGSFQASPP